MAIYNGTGTDRLRSLSGVKFTPANGNGNTTGQQEVDRVLRNNTTDGVEWYTEVWSDRLLLTALHVLISKSLDTQGSFGQGISSGSQTTKEAYVTGALDDKGLFFGDTVGTATAVKTFGIENFWSLVWHRIAGCISMDNVLKTKLTYGTADGSEAEGYNSTGNGYITESSIPTANGYTSKMKFSERGFMTKEVAGSTNKFYCDYFYQSSGTRYLLVGGAADYGASAGAFYFNLSNAFSNANWNIAAKKNPTVHDARQMLTYIGWTKCTDTYMWLKRHILSRVDFKKLRKIISEHDRRNNHGILQVQEQQKTLCC